MPLLLTPTATVKPVRPLTPTVSPTDTFEAVLRVVVDNRTPGSEGRLCLQLPDALDILVGLEYRTVGHMGRDLAFLLVSVAPTQTVTPRRQVWWKNGVREHNIRENWYVQVTPLLEGDVLACVLTMPTGEPTKKLPPHQDTFFG